MLCRYHGVGLVTVIGAVVMLWGMGALAGTILPLPIANASFEDPTLNEDSWSITLPGWRDVSSRAGIFHPSLTYFPAGAPDGSNIAYINNQSTKQTFTQDIVNGAIPVLLQAGEYTVTVDVGHRLDQVASDLLAGEFFVELHAGGTMLTPTAVTPDLGPTETFLTAGAGVFQEVTVTYDIGDTHAQLGQALSIVLGAQSDTQVSFDDVRVGYYIPEPASIVLTALGMATLLTRRRRQRQ